MFVAQLTTSMHQSDWHYADQLNRVHTATNTQQDLAVMKSTVLSDHTIHPAEAMHVFATNAMTD